MLEESTPMADIMIEYGQSIDQKNVNIELKEAMRKDFTLTVKEFLEKQNKLHELVLTNTDKESDQ